jgi:signal transduction histidine kinase
MTRMTTATAQTPATTEQTAAADAAAPTTRVFPAPWRRPSLGFGLRARIILVHIGLLAFAILASVLVARQLLLVRLEEQIDAELTQEVDELYKLGESGVDPETGLKFGADVGRLFNVFLERNIPSRHEVFLSYVEGKPFLRSPHREEPYDLFADDDLTKLWGGLEGSDRGDRGEIATPGGRVKYLAVPVGRTSRSDPARGERTGEAGVFVVANFRDEEEDELDGAILALGGVGLAILLIGSVLAWRLAGSVLGPVRAVTNTARAISETSLQRRIPERGSDEIAQLAATFNDMLDRLERAFVTQRRFLDDAGHELRTPITIVRGHLEFPDEEPEERERTVSIMLDELDRMGRIVDDLLLLAQADEPDFLQLDLVDVAALTSELETKASAIGRREWHVDAIGRGIIVADRQRLTQAVVQLAQNAVQHTKEGDEIALGSAVSPAGEASFWVRDSGPGIAPEDRERIFERFVRGAGGRRAGGAGLGLAIVRAIATAHGGRVELGSFTGDGTTVTIVVPTDQPEHEELA